MATEDKYNLLKIGLTDGEAKVYLALVELGSSTVGPIVKEAKVAYSNVYGILQRLIEKGIVSYIIKDKTKHFQAVSPKNLVDYLEKKEKEIAEQKETLKTLLPRLEQLQRLKPEQSAEIFLGKKGLKSAYEKLLTNRTAKDEYLFLYIHEDEYAKESDLFYFSIQEMFKKMKTRGISNQNYKKSAFMKQATYIDMRFVDFPIPGNFEVCGDRVLLISWMPIIAVLIDSKSIADNCRKYFNAVWKTARKV